MRYFFYTPAQAVTFSGAILALAELARNVGGGKVVVRPVFWAVSSYPPAAPELKAGILPVRK